MHELPVADPAARQAWLAAEQARYLDDPCIAAHLLAPTQALYEQVIAEGPSDFGVALALHLAELLGETWSSDQVEAVLDPVMPWLELGLGAPQRVTILALRCRMHWRFGRLPQAHALLAPLTHYAATSGAPLDQAHHARALGHLLSAQQQYAEAIVNLRRAIAGYTTGGHRGHWCDLFVSLSLALRASGDPDGALASLQQGVAVATSQRRWVSVCNALSGIVEDHVTRGQYREAETALAQAYEKLEWAGPTGLRIAKEVHAAEAVLHAARGDYGRAAALMKDVAKATRQWSMRRQLVRRLKQLAPWQFADGQTEAAFATQQQAHELELAEAREVARRDMSDSLERVELAHARRLDDLHAPLQAALAALPLDTAAARDQIEHALDLLGRHGG